jgi:hypothetical protein
MGAIAAADGVWNAKRPEDDPRPFDVPSARDQVS